MRQRYDDIAEWYDTYVTSGAGKWIARSADRLLAELLGRGAGRRCLDLGCGGGVYVPALTSLGWQVIGVDISVSQVALARRTCPAAVVGSADRLPLADGTVDAVATVMTTTDFPDIRAAFAEARRVLRPGGRFVVVAAHPCFGGVFVERDEHGRCIVHPGYRRHERIEEHPLLGDGIRSRVGVVNVPLPVLLNAIADAELVLRRTAEDDSDPPVPHLFALAAIRPIRT